MQNERGVALILALLVLSFLTVLGGALLTTTTIDIWIGDNYKTATQSLYLAEAGIEDGREALRTSGRPVEEILASGNPLIPSRELIDNFGNSGGRYTVWLRRDNGLLKLVSLGRLGGTQKTVEAVIQKAGFPDNDADPRLKTVRGLDGLAAAIANNAADVFETETIVDYGTSTNYKIAVVNRDAEIGGGTGYGILLVRGELNVTANFTWNGLILLIGEGIVHWNGFSPAINGGLFMAHTPGDAVFNITDAGEIQKANGPFPYNPIAFREK